MLDRETFLMQLQPRDARSHFIHKRTIQILPKVFGSGSLQRRCGGWDRYLGSHKVLGFVATRLGWRDIA